MCKMNSIHTYINVIVCFHFIYINECISMSVAVLKRYGARSDARPFSYTLSPHHAHLILFPLQVHKPPESSPSMEDRRVPSSHHQSHSPSGKSSSSISAAAAAAGAQVAAAAAAAAAHAAAQKSSSGGGHVRFLPDRYSLTGEKPSHQPAHKGEGDSSESETENTTNDEEGQTCQKFLLLIDQPSIEARKHLSIKDIGIILDRLASKIVDVERLDRDAGEDSFNWTIKATIRGDSLRELGVLYGGHFYTICEHPAYGPPRDDENEAQEGENDEDEDEEDDDEDSQRQKPAEDDPV